MSNDSMSLKSAYRSRQSVTSRSPLNSGRGSSCSTLSPRSDAVEPTLNLTLYGAPAPRSVRRSSKPQRPPSKPAPSPVNGPEPPSSPANGHSPRGPEPPSSPANGIFRSSPKTTSITSNGRRNNSPKHQLSPVNGSQSSSPKHPQTSVNGSQNNSPKHPQSPVNGSQSSSPKHPQSPVNGSQISSPKHPQSPVNGSQSSSPKHPQSPVNGSQSSSPKHPQTSVNGSQSRSPVNGSQSSSSKCPPHLVNGGSPEPAPSRPGVNGHRLGATETSRYEELPTPDSVSTPRRSVSPLDLSSLRHDDDDSVSPRVSSRTVSDVATESINIDLADEVSPRVSSRTVSDVATESINIDLADEVSPRVSSRTMSDVATESINIDLARQCNRRLSDTSSLSGVATSVLNSSSYVTISDYSTQSCSSLPCDDVTRDRQASLCSDVSRQHSSDKASLRSDTPGRRRFILERLESGYYSPDTTDVRLSVAEVLEAADYAHRLASLLDQALGRELGFEHADPQELYEDEHTMKQFLENVGRHPVFNSQNVERKVKYFESVEKLPPPPPLPSSLPYGGFKTVHDDTCFCCGPRVFFSPEDLLTQRSKLKKAPVKQSEVLGDGRSLCEILKDVISRRRDGVMPAEDLVCGSVRSDWSDRGD